MITRLHNFLRTYSHVFRAQHFPKRKDKIRLLRTLTSLYIKANLGPQKDKEVTHRIFDYKVSGFSYGSLLFLFKEIFINGEYFFTSDKPDPRIVDCGANIGMSIIYFKTLYPDCSILAFEPNPHAYGMIQKNIAQNKLQNVKVENIGLSNRSGEIEFYLGGYKGSLVGSIIPDRGGENVLKVKTEKLSRYIKNQKFDLIKIDIEGAETEVLQDLIESDVIKNIKAYIIEYHHKINKEKSAFSEFLRPFEQNGFEYNMNTSFSESGQFQDIVINMYQDEEVVKPQAVAI